MKHDINLGCEVCGSLAHDANACPVPIGGTRPAPLPPSDAGTLTPPAGSGGTCCDCGYAGTEETPCAKREDKTHCEHWWDGPDELQTPAAPTSVPTLGELTTAVFRVRTGTAKEAADFIATLESLHARASEADTLRELLGQAREFERELEVLLKRGNDEVTSLRALVAAMEERRRCCFSPEIADDAGYDAAAVRIAALRAELKLP